VKGLQVDPEELRVAGLRGPREPHLAPRLVEEADPGEEVPPLLDEGRADAPDELTRLERLGEDLADAGRGPERAVETVEPRLPLAERLLRPPARRDVEERSRHLARGRLERLDEEGARDPAVGVRDLLAPPRHPFLRGATVGAGQGAPGEGRERLLDRPPDELPVVDAEDRVRGRVRAAEDETVPVVERVVVETDGNGRDEPPPFLLPPPLLAARLPPLDLGRRARGEQGEGADGRPAVVERTRRENREEAERGAVHGRERDPDVAREARPGEDDGDWIYKLSQLARAIGGAFATPLLLSARTLPEHHRRRAREYHVEWLDGAELARLPAWLRGWMNG